MKSRIAIDKSQIAPFLSLNLGDALSDTPPAYGNPPPPIFPIQREMRSRTSATQSSEPLLVTQLAESGPDSDFVMSAATLAALTSAVCLKTPLALIGYNICGNCYFDEPVHHQFHELCIQKIVVE
jgi:hypothetical protein